MGRIARIALPGIALLVSLVALIAALNIGGGANPPLLGDPGLGVRFGLPIAKLLVDITAATLIGALVLALWAFDSAEAAYRKAIDLAAGSAFALTISAVAVGILTFVSVSNTPFSADPKFGQQLWFFVTSIALGQAWMWTIGLAAIVTVLCIAVTNQTALFFVGLVAMGSLVPMALQGHAAGISGHAAAITSLGLHLVFVSVWFGGVVSLVLLRKHIAAVRLTAIVSRYSTLAIIAFIVVAVSGVANAAIRLGGWDALFTSGYGQLVLLKVVGMLALGFFGFAQRGYLLRRMATDAARSAFRSFTFCLMASSRHRCHSVLKPRSEYWLLSLVGNT